MTDNRLRLDRARLDALLFDLDGVLTQTAKLHALAWKRLFDDFLACRDPQSGEDLRPFDPEQDYRTHVDGKPRLDGVRDFLTARGIALPLGQPDDPIDCPSLQGLGNRKNRLFRDLIASHGIQLRPCTREALHAVRQAGFKTAVVSASKNCATILERAELTTFFDTRVDGLDAERQGLAGKPQPDSFLEATERLGVAPARTALFEDAISGVSAGHRGHFGLVVGIDTSPRPPQSEGIDFDPDSEISPRARALLEAGADQVIRDLCAMEIGPEQRPVSPPPSPRQVPSEIDPDSLSQELKAVLADRQIALFLDYDGTLTPIVRRPEEARLGAYARQALSVAAERLHLTIMSGRDLADIQAMVGIPDLIYAGSHGFDIQGPALRLQLPEGIEAQGDLKEAERVLRRQVNPIAGARLEPKRFGLAIHYREVAESRISTLADIVEQVAGDFPTLRQTRGKMVIELQPDLDWDKGRALAWLMEQLEFESSGVLPIYIGDDETDEDAFSLLEDQGIGVLVSTLPEPSHAQYRLGSPSEVIRLINALSALEGRHA